MGGGVLPGALSREPGGWRGTARGPAMRTRWVEGVLPGALSRQPGGWRGTARGPVMRTRWVEGYYQGPCHENQVGGGVLPGALS